MGSIDSITIGWNERTNDGLYKTYILSRYAIHSFCRNLCGDAVQRTLGYNVFVHLFNPRFIFSKGEIIYDLFLS